MPFLTRLHPPSFRCVQTNALNWTTVATKCTNTIFLTSSVSAVHRFLILKTLSILNIRLKTCTSCNYITFTSAAQNVLCDRERSRPSGYLAHPLNISYEKTSTSQRVARVPFIFFCLSRVHALRSNTTNSYH